MEETKTDKVIRQAANILTNKQTRSTLFLVITFVIILAFNAVLPVIEGDAHYTVNAIEVTYAEYKEMKAENAHYRLAWASEQKIKLYIRDYIKAHPELTEEEKVLVEAPDALKVKVYTKFFYQYPFWYITTITSMGSSIMLYYSLFNFLITKAKDKYKEYVELKSRVDKLSKDHLDPATFEPWLENVFNRRRKIKQHINNVRYNLKRLETKTKYEVRKKFREYYELPRGSEESARVLAALGPLTRAERRYFRTKEQYLDMLDDTYINEYVVNGSVKYFKYIHPTFVQSGVNVQGRSVDSYSLIKSDAERILSDAGIKILLSVVTTVLFAILLTVTVIASYEQSAFWVVVNIISKIAPLVLQVPLAIDYANSYMETHLIPVLNCRRSIGLLYLADMYESNTLKQPLDDSLQKEINKEVATFAETH